MVIYLVNIAHNGDILFGQQIVKNICECNPNYNFIHIINYNEYLFNDILKNSLFLIMNFLMSYQMETI